METLTDINFFYFSSDSSFEFFHKVDIKPSPQDHGPHYDNAYEIYLFIKGEGIFNVEGNEYVLEPYSVLMMNSNELHTLMISAHIPYERIVIKIKPYFTPPFISHEIDLFRKLKFRPLGRGNKIKTDLIKNSGLLDLVYKLKTLCETKSAENELVAKCVIIQMLSIINNISDSDLLTDHKPISYKVNLVLKYINFNLQETLSLDLLSKKFNVTKHHLCHTFKQVTGYSINTYITYKRILMADKLILEGYTPTQACFMSGFNNYSSFYKAYCKAKGFSPKHSKIFRQ